MKAYEPCQVRKEAAISGSSYVPQSSLLQRQAWLSKGNFLSERTGKEALCTQLYTVPSGRRCSMKSSGRNISSEYSNIRLKAAK